MTSGAAARSPEPLVSICMPAFNASPWIGDAIESALGQTWVRFELIVVDDASSDSTLAVARSYSDPRIRVEANPANLGTARNHNRAVELARGPYIKFLHADDRLAPDCLEAMVELALEDEQIGLVFAPREVIVEGGDQAWSTTYANLHDGFDELARNNDGRRLFAQLLAGGLEVNWIGEPSAVMITRAAFDEAGPFSVRVRQVGDFDLWLRIMIRRRVGFVDRPLCVYRRHGASISAVNERAERDWLDRLWLVEGLLEADAPEREKIERLRRVALIRAARSQVRRFTRGRFETQLPAYLRHRLLTRGRRSSPRSRLYA
jgi:glycosyltransferase involved in cell wall biosynthesis